MPPAKEDDIKGNKKKLTFWDKHFGKESRLVKYEKSLTIFILITGMIVAIAAAYLGASQQALLAYNYENEQNKLHEQNVAKLLYIDIRNQNFLLSSLINGFNQQEATDPNQILHPIGKIYPDRGMYFAYQNEIASFDYPLAKNITQFYTDLILSDMANEGVNQLFQKNSSNAMSQYIQYKALIRDAYSLSAIIQKQLEDRYNITPDTSMTGYQ